MRTAFMRWAARRDEVTVLLGGVLEAAIGLNVLAGLSDEDIGGQPNEDARNFLVLRWLCDWLFETTETELYRGDGIPVTRLPRYTSASLIPVSNKAEAANYSQLLSKTTLYSDLVVMVIPSTLDAMETSYSVPGVVRDFDPAPVRDIVSLNRRYPDLVSAGRCVFLPSRLLYTYGTASQDLRYEYTPPFMGGNQSPYVPLNLRSPLTDPRELLLYKHILLPYFPDVDLLRIARLRDEETDSFIRFSIFLKRRLNDLAESESTQQIDALIEEIEYEVAGLRIEAQKLQKSRIFRDAKIASFAVSLGTMLSLGSGAAAGVAGIVGSVSALELFREWVDQKKAAVDLKKSDFYIPYLLSEEVDTGEGDRSRP